MDLNVLLTNSMGQVVVMLYSSTMRSGMRSIRISGRGGGGVGGGGGVKECSGWGISAGARAGMIRFYLANFYVNG